MTAARNWVHEAITRYTGVTDEIELAEIYGHMADSVRTFSSLSPTEFRREAREARAVNDYLKTDEGKAYMAALDAEWDAQEQPA